MEVEITKEELYSLVKEAVREVLQEEKLDLFLKTIPSVSPEEMQDIEKLHGQPSSEKKSRSVKPFSYDFKLANRLFTRGT